MKTNAMSVLLLVGIALGFSGCATPTHAIPGASPDLLVFLQDGATARADIVLRLGQPSAKLEQEKILTFRLGQDPKQGFYIIRTREGQQWQWESVRYSLVLIFNAEGVLQKHNLVLVE